MKYIDEYRSPEIIEKYISAINRMATDKWNIMEICGGQTHAIFRFGLDRLLPHRINLLHGPGCPVCVTPAELVDKAIHLSLQPDVILCTFGDMMRVPGSGSDLMQARSHGADIRIVYSPLDAIDIARQKDGNSVVLFAIGFETTAPLIASVILTAQKLGLGNLSILNGMVRIPPAIESLLNNPNSRIDALLAPGHVCTVSGYTEYENISDEYKIPIVVTGFEPLDLVQGIYMAVAQLEMGDTRTVNQYSRAVYRGGNVQARKTIDDVFDITDGEWRGLGLINNSGYALKDVFRQFDAETKFDISIPLAGNHKSCLVPEVLQGLARPNQCPEFGKACTPEHPLGPMMVSSEGSCAAYYKNRSAYAAGK